MKRLFIICSFLLFGIVSVIAGRGYDYHVRDYAIYDRSDPTLTIFLLILAAIGLVYCMIVAAVQQKQEKKQKKKEPAYYYRTSDICPVCGGTGFLKGEQFDPSNFKCPHCEGHGKKLTPEIKNLMEELSKEEIEMKKRKEEGKKRIAEKEAKESEERVKYGKTFNRKIGDFNYSISDLAIMEEKDFREICLKNAAEIGKLRAEISRAKSSVCEHCKGKGKKRITCSVGEFFIHDEFCEYCGGVGRILTEVTEETKVLYDLIQNKCKELREFRRGFHLFNYEDIRSESDLMNSIMDGTFFTPLEGDTKTKLQRALDKAPKCSHCHGTGLDIDYTVEKGDFSFEKKYYKKKECYNCNGSGTVSIWKKI